MSKEEKQQYLVENIIDSGYDANKFFFYIKSLKENEDGADLDVWTFQELKQIVSDFQDDNNPIFSQVEARASIQNSVERVSFYQNENEQEQEQFQHNLNQIDEQEQEEEEEKQNNEGNEQELINQESYETEQSPVKQNNLQRQTTMLAQEVKLDNEFEIIDKESFKESMQHIQMKKYGINEEFMKKSIKCQKLNITIPIHKKIKIIVTDPQKQAGYLFGLTGNYILFKIITKPYNWEVQRRMTDFQALRQILVKLYPGKLIPPLDPNLKENNQHEIGKRMRFLNNFLNDLKNSPNIWYHPYVISFFSDSREKWEQTIKQGEKEKHYEKIKCNISGEIPIRFCNENYEYKEELEQYINQSEQLYTKLHLTSKQLSKDFENLGKTLNEMQNHYYTMFKNINDFTMKVAEGQISNKKLSDSYFIFAHIFENWEKQMQKTSMEIKNMTNNYKYSFNECKVQKELFKNCNQAEDIFVKYQQIYNSKSSYGKQSQDEDQYYDHLKEEYVYWLSQLCRESQNMYQKKGDDNIQFINYICKSQTQKVNETFKAWSDVCVPYIKNPFPIPREQIPLIIKNHQENQQQEQDIQTDQNQ